NAGENTLTSGRVELRQNGTLLESKRVTFNLATGESFTVNFNEFSLLPTTNTIEFRITQANDVPDNVTTNNSRIITPILEQPISLPYTESFNTFP
ncbi:CARDB domain-containing protein, partial [Campylobacter fetus subsp. venerealis]